MNTTIIRGEDENGKENKTKQNKTKQNSEIEIHGLIK